MFVDLLFPGIEYVVAGYVCNVCQWFYKAAKDTKPDLARADHMNSGIHAKEVRFSKSRISHLI